jgi:acetamidase/formamidase
MTDTMAIDRSQWAEQLDAVTRDHEGDEVTIEVLDKDWGDVHEAERMPFTYVTYDKKDDAVIIGVGGRSAAWPVLLRHMVRHPVEVSLAAVGDEVGLRVAEQHGTVTLVTIRAQQV